MIDLNLYKNKKQKNELLNMVDAFVETRKIYNGIKEIADSEDGKYTEEQKFEASELTRYGFLEFVKTINSLQK